jgi:hypothetical protein
MSKLQAPSVLKTPVVQQLHRHVRYFGGLIDFEQTDRPGDPDFFYREIPECGEQRMHVCSCLQEEKADERHPPVSHSFRLRTEEARESVLTRIR